MAKKIGLEKQKELLRNAALTGCVSHQNLIKRYIDFCENRSLAVLPITRENAAAFAARGKIDNRVAGREWRGLSAANVMCGFGDLPDYRSVVFSAAPAILAATPVPPPQEIAEQSRDAQKQLLLATAEKYGNTYRCTILKYIKFCESESLDYLPLTAERANAFINSLEKVQAEQSAKNLWSGLQTANLACGGERFLTYQEFKIFAIQPMPADVDFKTSAALLRKYWIAVPGHGGKVQVILRKYLAFCDDLNLKPLPMTLPQCQRFLNSVRAIKSESVTDAYLRIMSNANRACGGLALEGVVHKNTNYTKAIAIQKLEDFCENLEMKNNKSFIVSGIKNYINYCKRKNMIMLPITAKKLHKFFAETSRYTPKTIKTYFSFFSKANVFAGEKALVYAKAEAKPPQARAGSDTSQWSEEVYAQKKEITVLPPVAADEGDERGGYCYKFKVRNGKTVLNNLKSAKAHVRSMNDAPRIYKRVVDKIKNNDIFYRDTAAGKLAIEMGASYAEQ